MWLGIVFVSVLCLVLAISATPSIDFATRLNFNPYEKVYTLVKNENFRANYQCPRMIYLPENVRHPEIGLQSISLGLMSSEMEKLGFGSFVCDNAFLLNRELTTSFLAIGTLADDLGDCALVNTRRLVGLEIEGEIPFMPIEPRFDSLIQLTIKVKFTLE